MGNPFTDVLELQLHGLGRVAAWLSDRSENSMLVARLRDWWADGRATRGRRAIARGLRRLRRARDRRPRDLLAFIEYRRVRAMATEYPWVARRAGEHVRRLRLQRFHQWVADLDAQIFEGLGLPADYASWVPGTGARVDAEDTWAAFEARRQDLYGRKVVRPLEKFAAAHGVDLARAHSLRFSAARGGRANIGKSARPLFSEDTGLPVGGALMAHAGAARSRLDDFAATHGVVNAPAGGDLGREAGGAPYVVEYLDEHGRWWGAHEPGRPADTRGTRRRRASYVDNKFEAVNGEDAARVGHADVGAGWPVRTGRGPRGKGGRRAT